MLEFKPESEATLLDRVRTALTFCKSVKPVDMGNPGSKMEFYRALVWEWSHGIVRFTPDGAYPPECLRE